MDVSATTIVRCNLTILLQPGRIATASHCFGCTAGSGSSCGGAIENVAASVGSTVAV